MDVTPTLLDLAGVPVPEGLSGRSLLAAASAADAASRPVLSESLRSVRDGARTVTARVASARTLAAKYVLTYDAATGKVLAEEVFDLAKDAGEKAPLAPSEVAHLAGALCRAARALRDTARRLAGEPVPASPAGCAAGE